MANGTPRTIVVVSKQPSPTVRPWSVIDRLASSPGTSSPLIHQVPIPESVSHPLGGM